MVGNMQIARRTLLLLLLCAGAAFAGEPTWVQVRSEHFSVITDAGEKNGRHVTDQFEQMRAVFGLLFARAKVNEPVPLQIVAFRNTKEFKQYCPLFRGKIVELTGFFQQGEDKNFVAVDMSREGSWQTVFHEYAHVLLNANYMQTAPWFDEGFAEFFSSMRVTGGDIAVGQAIPGSELLVQANKLKLLDLFLVQHHSETYNQSGQAREMFYVESWLVVHYLFDTNRIPQTAKYFQLVNDQKVPVAQAVQQAFGLPPAELEKTIVNYLRTGKIIVMHLNGRGKFPLSYNASARPLEPVEVRAQLADLHWHSEDYGAVAIKEFEAIVQENPTQLDAQRGLGYAYLRERNLAKAAEHLQAAARLGSKDPRVYFYTAVLLQEQSPAAMRSPELVQNLRRAIELDPQYADAYAMLGLSLMNSGNFAEAEPDLVYAVALSPRNDMYRMNYAVVLLNQQKLAEAKTTLSAIVNSSTPQVADQASRMLQQISSYESRPAPTVAVGRLGTSKHEAEERSRDESPAPDAPVDRTGSSKPGVEEPSSYASNSPAAAVKVSYLKGTLVAVDCSAPPLAVLSVVSDGKTWKMKVANSDHVVVIGADKFSCAWSHKKVALNYSPTAANEGRVITVEIQ